MGSERRLCREYSIFALWVALVGLAFTLTVAAQPASLPQFPQQPFRTIEQLERWPGAADSVAGVQPASPLAPEVSIHWAHMVYQQFGASPPYPTNRWDIYRHRPDVSGVERVISHGTASIHPQLNRGSTSIVFVARIGAAFEIFRATADGDHITQLTFTGSDNIYPVWSPDGGKIAFQSYRDGQAEIYVMNADGSGQTRLTHQGGYDGMPAWSPDGQKIAFSSQRGGGHRIFVMNADGSQVTQLSHQSTSAYPAWSPDGQHIAYSADGNGDGWLELWLMDADGGNQRLLLAPPGQTDAWVSGWSPTGQRITYTLISFIQHEGQWYWVTAYSYGYELSSSSSALLVTGSTTWHLHWETADITPPVTSLTPLPPETPYAFDVIWASQDIGPAGVQGHDLQYRQGSNGAWVDLPLHPWQQSQYRFSDGVGGQSYQFRVRAFDRAGNVGQWRSVSTTVESQPPRTTARPLAPFSRVGRPIHVKWQSYDPGGSGVGQYETQYRINDGDWIDWWTLEDYDTGVVYEDGVAGETYHFRVRGIDRAQNVEPWPAAEGNVQTTVYNSAVVGVVQDNSGTPVQTITLTTNPPSLGSFTGDDDGRYATYLAIGGSSYDVQWSKAGYGPLPMTSLPVGVDSRLPIVLPPADNVAKDSGFESGILGADWLPSGTLSPVITTTRHTGDYSLFFGQPMLPFVNSHFVGEGQQRAQLIVAPDQTVHAVWINQLQLLYSQRVFPGGWSAPVQVANADIFLTQLAVDGNNTLHLIWQTSSGAYYAQRPSAGSWTTPQLVYSGDNYMNDLQMVVSGDGVAHIAWAMTPEGDYYDDIFYARRAANGVWSAPHNMSLSYGEMSFHPRLAVDNQGGAHAIWIDHTMRIFYARRSPAGNWGAPLLISQPNGELSLHPHMAVEPGGVVHVIWYSLDDGQTYYRRRSSGGGWSALQPLAVGDIMNVLKLDNEGNLHIAGGYPYPYHIKRSVNGDWSPLTSLALPDLPDSEARWLDIDGAGHAHLIYFHYDSEQFLYARWMDEDWSAPLTLDGDPETNTVFDLTLVLDNDNQPHMIWRSGYQRFYYFGPEWAPTADTAVLAQSVTISPTIAAPTLSFLYQAGGLTTAGASSFTVSLDNGVSSTAIAALHSNVIWRPISVDLSDWLGQTVTLTFKLDQAQAAPVAWLYLDQVTLGSTYPDVWVVGDYVNALPGEEARLTLTYSNRGGAAAVGVQLTYTLPANVSFVSANIPPITTSPPVWNLGDLPAKGESAVLELVVAVSPDAPSFADLLGTAVIGASTPELELVNNSAQTVIRTERHLYLPTLFR